MKVLIAEDDRIMQSFLIETLDQFGFQYIDAVTSGRALYLLGVIPYDLLIVDITLPDWNGLEGLSLAKTFGNSSPVIISTGRPDLVEDRSLNVIAKPFSPDELKNMIEKILGIDLPLK